jgi:squalene-associated FAD-dependent desaturase
MKVAIMGAGWAGLAAAITAVQKGHKVTLFEASHHAGGRARSLQSTLPDGQPVALDNGQHILIGAYTDTLRLMRTVGVDPASALLRLPLTLKFPDGNGIELPAWPSPLDALAGIAHARGWNWADRWSLLQAAAGWQLRGFRCDEHTTVADLCRTLRPSVRSTLIDPLCVSALNTPAERASGRVFLRVLRDSLFGGAGASNLLLPRIDLNSLFPNAALQWLQAQGARIAMGQRVAPRDFLDDNGWLLGEERFDAVVCAGSSSNMAADLMDTALTATDSIASDLRAWTGRAAALQFEAITTVYAFAPAVQLPQPMLALYCDAADAPAQFVFDRGQLGGPAGLLALVVSASHGDRLTLQAKVLHQAQKQLQPWLQDATLQAVQTVVEKRATFACTPALQRPPGRIAQGLVACGDYVEGPYPATLEGAIRSGCDAIRILETS